MSDKLPPLPFTRRHEEEVEPEGLTGWLFGGGMAAGVAGSCLAGLWISLGGLSVWNGFLLVSGLSMTLKGVMQTRLPPRPPEAEPEDEPP